MRAETAEGFLAEKTSEARKYEKEADRYREDLVREQRQFAAEQRKLHDAMRRERQLQESTVPESELRRTEAALETAVRERAELLAANQQLSAEMRGLAATNSELESRFRLMMDQA